MITIQRIYNTNEEQENTYRILIDRLWPRGISKEQANINLWLKEIAPSTELRKWFNHDTNRWIEFQTKYKKELQSKTDLLKKILDLEKEHQSIILLYGAKDENHNHAIVLHNFLKDQ